jgi:hypothetical protein
MAEKTEYECKKCGSKRTREGSEEAPDCCDQPMVKAPPLPVCEVSETAEHSRMDDLGEPCDDGRAGKI